MKDSMLFDRLFRDQWFGNLTISMCNIAQTVIAKNKSTPLTATFETQGPHSPTPIMLQRADFRGTLEWDCWMSGYVLYFVLTHALRHRNDVYVLDPQAANYKFLSPVVSLRSLNFIVQPVLIGTCHWGLIVFKFDWASNKTTVCVYHPQNKTDQRGVVISLWESYTQKVVDSWHCRDYAGQPIGEILLQTVKKPMRDISDGGCCGFLCLLVAMITVGEFRLREDYLMVIPSPCDNSFEPVLHKLDIEAL